MKRRTLLALGFGIALLPACTAVLGMDRAELDEGLGGAAASGAGASGAGGSGGTQSAAPSECTRASNDCVDCLNSCGAYRTDCLADRACRKALDHYAICLKGDCSDDGGCIDRFRQEVSTPTALTLLDCLRDECVANGGPCVGSAMITKCERYCACMQQNCGDQFRSWPSSAQCIQACEGLPAYDRDCRGDHCEFGADDLVHCRHAVAEEGLNKCAAASSIPPQLCLDRSDVKGPCSTSSDCCDGLTCLNQECGR